MKRLNELRTRKKKQHRIKTFMQIFSPKLFNVRLRSILKYLSLKVKEKELKKKRIRYRMSSLLQLLKFVTLLQLL